MLTLPLHFKVHYLVYLADGIFAILMGSHLFLIKKYRKKKNETFYNSGNIIRSHLNMQFVPAK